MPVDNHTIDWIRERIRDHHHKALTKYLIWRTPELTARDEAANLSVNQILICAFRAKNGQTTVPKAAMKVLRHVRGTNPRLVWNLCLEAAPIIPDMKYLKGSLQASRARDPEFAGECDRIESEMTVCEVMNL